MHKNFFLNVCMVKSVAMTDLISAFVFVQTDLFLIHEPRSLSETNETLAPARARLTHCGLEALYRVLENFFNAGYVNGLSPVRHQAIT